MKRTPMLIAGALSAAIGCGSAIAQTPADAKASAGSSVTGGQAAPAAQPGTGTRNSETRKDDKLSRTDRRFIEQAAESGMFEVQVAQLAASKATDAGVKDFANKLVTDHQQANNELVQLANARHVELPAAPSRGQRHEVEKLAKRSGADFDKHFVQEVGIKVHEKDIHQFEKASGKVQDPELKAWVQKTMPHLREHLAMAQKLPEAANR